MTGQPKTEALTSWPDTPVDPVLYGARELTPERGWSLATDGPEPGPSPTGAVEEWAADD